jgi:two-component system OmpR family sensor kinase
MRGLVDDLLHLARLDEARPLALADTDVGELVRDVCADAATARPTLDITADAPEPGRLQARLDRGLVTQIVAGLIDNAATHAPGAAVEVSAGRSDGASGSVEIMVADDGPGMDASQAEHVFDRFYRGDGSRSRRQGGSGLGLAIAAAVAERHGGSISLKTGVDEGCAFTLRLPDGSTSKTVATSVTVDPSAPGSERLG